MGTRHQPYSARSCELALRAVGVAGGCPGGALLAWVWGVPGRGLSHPRLPALWAGCRGPLPTGCGCGGVRAWGPVTNPTARALASWLCALLGRHEGARGGRLLPGCGASGVGRSPTPDCPPFGRAAGAHYPLAVGAGGCGRGDPSPTPQRALLQAGFAHCWGGTRAPEGGRLLPMCGASGVGRSPTPNCPPSGRAAGAHCPPAVDAGGCGCAARVCVCVPCLAGSVGPVSWARFGAPHLSFGRSWFALCLFGPLRAGVALFVVVGRLFCFLSPSTPRCAPVVSCFACFPAPGALGLGVLSPPPSPFFFLSFFFFPSPPSVRPVVSCFVCFPAWGALGLGVLLPPPFFFSCAAVWCCAVVPCRLFLFFSLLVALVSCCSPLVRGSGPVPGRFCFCALPVRCCAGAPASLLSVPGLLALVLLPVVFVCLLLGLAVLCCLLVGPGGSWCRVSVACCGVSLGAALRRVAARCVVVRCVPSFCSVWCCRALCCALGRCPLSWGPVPSGAVFCFVPPRCVCVAVVCCCVVLFAVVLCAVCALGCRVVRFLWSPACAVLLCGPLSLGALLPCAVPRGAVLPRGAVMSCPAALLGLFLAWVWLYLLVKPLQNFVIYFFSFFFSLFWLLKIKKNYTQPDTLACSMTMYAAVPYVLPVVLDVLGLILVRGVVERVVVRCEGLTVFPQGRRLSCTAGGVMGTRVGREVHGEEEEKGGRARREESWRVMKSFRLLRAARDAFFFAPIAS